MQEAVAGKNCRHNGYIRETDRLGKSWLRPEWNMGQSALSLTFHTVNPESQK
jgi:hypothetical protein